MNVPKSTKRFFSLACFFFLLQTGTSYSQVYGCKDPAANNYNASATENDGSCQYNQTFYTPPIKVDPISNVLVETSGLQWAGNHLWSFNDNGHDAVLFRMDTASAAILQTVALGGATNVDWEDIAFDGTHFYIGDFGNNANGARTNLRIYKLPLSAIPDYTTTPNVTIPSTQVEVITFRYSDQAQPPVTSSVNSTRYDCEAMIVDGGRIHLFTKNWIESNTTHYIIDGVAEGNYVATPLETLATNYLVTAADKVPNSDTVILMGYQNSGTGSHFLHLLSDFRDGYYFNGNKRRIDLPSAAEMGQAEGIAFRNANYGYISNEKFIRTVMGFTIAVDQKLRTFNTNSFLSATVLPLKLKRFAATPGKEVNQLQWSFVNQVEELKLQHSTNRIDFATIQSFWASAKGNFSHQSTTTVNCYRLFWKETNGTNMYSETICLNNEMQNAFSGVLLRNSGELSFTLRANQAIRYSFRLLTADGRLVAQIPSQLAIPGTNKLQFSKSFGHNIVVLLQVIGEEESKSMLLKVD